MSASQFLAATYGSYYDPEKRSPPHVLGDNFTSNPLLAGLIAALTTARTTPWQTTTSTPSQAMTALLAALVPTGSNYALNASTAVYRDLYGSNGQVIGHITIVWPYVNGQPVVLQQPTVGPFDF